MNLSVDTWLDNKIDNNPEVLYIIEVHRELTKSIINLVDLILDPCLSALVFFPVHLLNNYFPIFRSGITVIVVPVLEEIMVL